MNLWDPCPHCQSPTCYSLTHIVAWVAAGIRVAEIYANAVKS
jgi:hypothetical protein